MFRSKKLTWRDVQHLIIRTSNPNAARNDKKWITNGSGLKGNGSVLTYKIIIFVLLLLHLNSLPNTIGEQKDRVELTIDLMDSFMHDSYWYGLTVGFYSEITFSLVLDSIPRRSSV